MTTTSFSTFVCALQDDFDTYLATPQSMTVEWPNAPFEAPAAPALYARVTVQMADAKQAQFGTPKRYRHAGQLVVNVFSPLNVGERGALDIADLVANRYRTTERAGAQFGTPSLVAGGRDDGRWLVTVRCPFYVDRLI